MSFLLFLLTIAFSVVASIIIVITLLEKGYVSNLELDDNDVKKIVERIKKLDKETK